jgi:hypothetical protein
MNNHAVRIFNMRIFAPLFFLLILIPQDIWGQSNVNINDVSFRLENNTIVVEYNLISSLADEKFNIELKFVSETDQIISPKSITGDIGKNVIAGKGKRITWDYASDRFEFSGNLKAVVKIAPSATHSRGPVYALLSVAVPGLGGHFVQDKKLRPIATTVGTAGLLTYGIIMKSQSNKYYDDYKQSVDYADYQTNYDKANSAHHKYYIATRIAAVVWIADIIWVYSTGRKNIKELNRAPMSSTGSGFTLDYMNNELLIGYKLTF